MFVMLHNYNSLTM